MRPDHDNFRDEGFGSGSDTETQESGSFFFQSALDEDQWYDAWSEELVTTYHILKDHCESQGLPFLETCTFSNFLDFAYRFSSKRPPPY